MTNIQTAAKFIRKVIAAGNNPASYRLGLSRNLGLTVEEVDAAIAAVSAEKIARVDPEVAAQARIAEYRSARGTEARRAFDHEED